MVQFDLYYESRAIGVTSEVGLTTDQRAFRAVSLLLLLSHVLDKHDVFYTIAISEVMWYEPLYNI